MGRSFEDAYEAEFIHAWAELSDSEIADAIGLRLTTATAGPGETIAPGGLWTVEHPDLNTVYGSVHPDAATCASPSRTDRRRPCPSSSICTSPPRQGAPRRKR
jgi:hypothetical protein